MGKNNYFDDVHCSFIDFKCLHDEIEIIEEKPKKIEELELEKGSLEDKEFLAKYITHNRYKINELTNAVNYLLEKKSD